MAFFGPCVWIDFDVDEVGAVGCLGVPECLFELRERLHRFCIRSHGRAHTPLLQALAILCGSVLSGQVFAKHEDGQPRRQAAPRFDITLP
jgi:hypothetical protein